MIWTEPTALAARLACPTGIQPPSGIPSLAGAARGSIVLLAGRPGAGKIEPRHPARSRLCRRRRDGARGLRRGSPDRVRERALRVCPTLPATLLAVAETRVRRLRELCEQSAAGLLIVTPSRPPPWAEG